MIASTENRNQPHAAAEQPNQPPAGEISGPATGRLDHVMPTAEHYRYRFLMGAMHQSALVQTVRQFCIQGEVDHLDDITQAWRGASARMTDLANREAGLPDRISASDPPAATQARLTEIAADHLFRMTFSGIPTSFKVVDIDDLVAPQRDVNLDYVDMLRKRIPGKSVEELIEFCVGPATVPPEVKALQAGPAKVVFSSRSLDLRFLGGFPKPITDADIEVAYMGGQPMLAISLLVGFGASAINTFMVGRRVVLNNGFHRVVALRMDGIKRIPVVVQHVANVEIEFPAQLLNLTLAYLLNSPRPVLVRDFFDDELTIDVRLTPRRKVVSVQWGSEDGFAPD